MQKRGKSSVVRRSGFGDLPKSEKPENKNGKAFVARREELRVQGKPRLERWLRKCGHEPASATESLCRDIVTKGRDEEREILKTVHHMTR